MPKVNGKKFPYTAKGKAAAKKAKAAKASKMAKPKAAKRKKTMPKKGGYFKLGVGHDFTDFADGSPDLDFDNQDFFGNVTSKL